MIARVELDDPDRVRLPARLWAEGLHIGERVLVETAEGEVVRGEIALGVDLAPVVALEAPLDQGARRATVRRPRP